MRSLKLRFAAVKCCTDNQSNFVTDDSKLQTCRNTESMEGKCNIDGLLSTRRRNSVGSYGKKQYYEDKSLCKEYEFGLTCRKLYKDD
jgi:hypothetical protein